MTESERKHPVLRARALLAQEEIPESRELFPEFAELRATFEQAQHTPGQSARELLVSWQDAADRDLAVLLARYDAAEPASATAKQALDEMRGQLARRCYIGELLEDVTR